MDCGVSCPWLIEKKSFTYLRTIKKCLFSGERSLPFGLLVSETTVPTFLPFFLSFDTALPPREDNVQVDCVLKPRYKKCTEKEKIKMIVFKKMV